MQHLIDGHTINYRITYYFDKRNYEFDNTVFSIMLMMGYLKIEKALNDYRHYTLSIPNLEAKYQIKMHYQDQLFKNKDELSNLLHQALKEENREQLDQLLNMILNQTIIFNETKQDYFKTIFNELLPDYCLRIKDIENGFLIQLLSKDYSDSNYILAFKITNRINLKNECKNVVKLVNEMDMIKQLNKEGYNDIQVIGISLLDKYCYINIEE